MEAKREPKLKYKVDFQDLEITITNIEIWDKVYGLKKGDIIEIIDRKENLKAKCRVKNIIKKDFTNDRIKLEIVENTTKEKI